MKNRIFLNLMFAFVLSFFSFEAFADDNSGSGSGQGQGSGETDAQRLAASLKRQEELEAELAEIKKGGKKDDDKGTDLNEKAKNEREDKERRAKENSEVERALTFNLTIDKFVDENKAFMPDEISGILAAANKEKYDTASEKAAATKAAIITSYFSVQENLDSLTASQKRQIEDWNRRTLQMRQTLAPDLYENIFEPAIETQRKIKKAEEVSRTRNGIANHTASQSEYQQKLIAHSQKAHLKKA